MAFRLRLEFQEHILSESQQLDGLKRSWILVDPGDRTISDLICHLIDTFNLYDSCPDGILLTMDGFVLPPFESIGMLRDAEVICVKRKGAKLVDAVQGKEGETDLLEHNVEQKQQSIPGVQLLANGEFVQETGGYQSETDEDNDEAQSDAHEENMTHLHVPAKKRKASEEPGVDAVLAKKRKVPKEPKSTNSLNKGGEATISPYSQPNRSGQSRSAKRKKIKRQLLRNVRAAEKEKMQSPQEEEKADSGSEKEQISNTDGHQQAPDEDSSAEDKVVHVASRSARRKKAKRRWIRSILASKEKQMQSPQDEQKADSGSDEDKNSNTDKEGSPQEEEQADLGSDREHISDADDHQQDPDEDSSAEDEVVRVASRSARRKKAKRQRNRAILAAEEKQMQSPQDKQKADSRSDEDKNLNTDEKKEEEQADSGSEKEHISNADNHQQDPDEDSSAEDEVVRVASRSARRKKAKRQWIRSILASKEKQMQSPQDEQKADSGSDADKNSNTDKEKSQEEEQADSGSEKEHISDADDHQQDPDEDSSAEDEVVRVASRSARRKKAKRQRNRAILAAEEKQMQSPQDKQKADSRSDEDKNLNTDKEMEEEKADSGSEKEHISNADDHQRDPDEDSSAEDEVVRVPSRSARRKKAKRRRIRAILAAEGKQSPQDKQKADSRSDKDKNLNTDNRQQEPDDDEDSDTDGEAVPVTIRPGHILFASPGKVKEVEQHKEVKESFNWSGTMNKRKGQKWGSQLQTTSKWNENGENSKWNENRISHKNQLATGGNGCGSPKEKQSKSWQNDHKVPDRNRAAENAPADNGSIDYEKLLPMTDSPVKGDIITYRLVELSSSFCPELTAYRVGKVSWFDSKSNKIMLSLLPQYPFEFKKSANDDEDDELLPDTSLYNEDGSLEIEFQSLVDVRVVERGMSASPLVVQHKANGAPASGSFWTTETPKARGSSTQAWPIKVNGTRGNKSAFAQTETSSSNKPSPQPQPTSINITGANHSIPRPNPGNGSNEAWEEITAALSAKKAELSKEDKWNKNQSGAKRPWSYRAMRNGALGPTLALLRTQNGPQPNQ